MRTVFSLVALATLVAGLCGCAPLQRPAEQFPPPAPLPLPPVPLPPPGSPGKGVAALPPEPPPLTTSPVQPPAAVPGAAEARPEWTSNRALESVLLDLAAAGSDPVDTRIQVVPFGHSAGNSPLYAVRVSAAAAAPAGRRPAVLLIGQQRGDEPASCEALLALLREALHGAYRDVLALVDLVVIPRLNPDRAQSQRPGNAAGIAIDSDHLVLRTPEARALAELIRELDPAVLVDLRDFDASPGRWDRFGGTPAADFMLGQAVGPELPPFVARAAEQWFHRPLAEALGQGGWSWEWLAEPSFDAVSPVLDMGGALPNNTVNVQGLKNVVSLVVAVRAPDPLGSADRARRSQAHRAAIDSILASVGAHAGDLAQVHRFVSEDVAAQACRGTVLLEAWPSRMPPDILLRDTSGRAMPARIERDSVFELQLGASRPRPCGYWLGAEERGAVDHLEALGVHVVHLAFDASALGSTYAAAATTGARQQMVDSLLEMPAGSYYVSLEQPLANIAVAALEPGTSYGFAAKGVLSSTAQLARVRKPL